MPTPETLKDDLLFETLLASEADGLLDIKLTRLELTKPFLTEWLLEETFLGDLELLIPMDRTPLTLELKKMSSLEDLSLDLLTYKDEFLDNALLLDASTRNSMLLKAATLDIKTLWLLFLITSNTRSNGADFTSLALILLPLNTLSL